MSIKSVFNFSVVKSAVLIAVLGSALGGCVYGGPGYYERPVAVYHPGYYYAPAPHYYAHYNSYNGYNRWDR